jgi:hypothetical protein
MMRSSVNPVSQPPASTVYKPLTWGFNVSEGDLNPHAGDPFPEW